MNVLHKLTASAISSFIPLLYALATTIFEVFLDGIAGLKLFGLAIDLCMDFSLKR